MEFQAEGIDVTDENPTPAASSGAVKTASSASKPQKWWQKKSTKTLVMLLVVALAVFIVSRSIKPEEFRAAFEHMKPWWFLAALAAGTFQWLGAGIITHVFAGSKVSFRGILLTQIASSFVGVVAPAGLGSLALSIRYLMKQGLASAQAVATMVLVELSQFLTSSVLVVGAIVFVGINPDVKIPWKTVGYIALAAVVVVAVIIGIKKSRDWVIAEVKSVWSKFHPQAVWAFKHPKELAIAVCGSLIQTGSFAASFVFSLLAFGVSVNPIKVTAAYLVANTLGSMIPVPGGVGSVEAALTVGMTAIGVPAAVGLSAAVTFRIATFYVQIPIGWVAFEYMERKQLI